MCCETGLRTQYFAYSFFKFSPFCHVAYRRGNLHPKRSLEIIFNRISALLTGGKGSCSPHCYFPHDFHRNLSCFRLLKRFWGEKPRCGQVPLLDLFVGKMVCVCLSPVSHPTLHDCTPCSALTLNLKFATGAIVVKSGAHSAIILQTTETLQLCVILGIMPSPLSCNQVKDKCRPDFQGRY